MATCALCKGEIGIVFLEKIDGTHVRDRKGKRHPVCSGCQSAKGMDAIRAAIGN